MNKKLILVFIFALIMFPFISAEFIGTFKVGENFEITNFCNSGDCTFMNLSSIVNPNGTVFYFNEVMTKNVQEFNYTFLTNSLGDFDFKTCADPGGDFTCESDQFKISPSGKLNSTDQSLLYIVLLFFNLLVFIFFLYFAIKLPYSNERDKKGSVTRVTKAKYLKLLSILFSYASFLWLITTISNISINFLNLDTTKNLIINLYRFVQGFSNIITIVIFGIMMIETWRDVLFSKAIKRFGKAIPRGNM